MIMILAARAVCGLGTAFSVRPAFRQSGGVWVDRLCLRVASRNVQAHRGSAGSVCLFGGIVVPVREARWHGGTGGMAREINRCKPLARLQHSQKPSGGQHARGAWLWSPSWRMCVMSLHGLLGIISPSYGDEMTNLHTPSNTCCPGIVDGLGWQPRPP